MPYKDKEQYTSYQKTYQQQHSKVVNATGNAWKKANRDKVNAYRRQYGVRLKQEILSHYGGGRAACVSCGFDDIVCLSIDHVNGGGTRHIKTLGGGSFLYRWLKKNDFPQGYQTLCMNCQWKKRAINRECPK